MADVQYKKGSTDVSATSSYYGGALPVDSDNFYMSEGTGIFSTQASTAIAGVTLASMQVSDGCSVQVGDESNPLRVDITDLRIYGRGPAFYFQGGTDAGVITTALFDPAFATARLNLVSLANTTLRVFAGQVVAPSTVTLNNIEVDGPGQVIAQEHASDTIEGTCTVCNGGTLIARRRIAGNVYIGEGGTVIYDVDTTTTTGQTFHLLGGKLMILKGSAVINQRVGMLDYSRLERTGYTFTITERRGVVEQVGGIEPTYSRTVIRPSRKVTV